MCLFQWLTLRAFRVPVETFFFGSFDSSRKIFALWNTEFRWSKNWLMGPGLQIESWADHPSNIWDMQLLGSVFCLMFAYCSIALFIQTPGSETHASDITFSVLKNVVGGFLTIIPHPIKTLSETVQFISQSSKAAVEGNTFKLALLCSSIWCFVAMTNAISTAISVLLRWWAGYKERHPKPTQPTIAVNQLQPVFSAFGDSHELKSRAIDLVSAGNLDGPLNGSLLSIEDRACILQAEKDQNDDWPQRQVIHYPGLPKLVISGRYLRQVLVISLIVGGFVYWYLSPFSVAIAIAVAVVTMIVVMRSNLAHTHGTYQTELGIPLSVAALENAIFNGLPADERAGWPAQFLQAIPVGADLSNVWHEFAIWLLEDDYEGIMRFAKKSETVAAVFAAVEYHRRRETRYYARLEEPLLPKRKRPDLSFDEYMAAPDVADTAVCDVAYESASGIDMESIAATVNGAAEAAGYYAMYGHGPRTRNRSKEQSETGHRARAQNYESQRNRLLLLVSMAPSSKRYRTMNSGVCSSN